MIQSPLPERFAALLEADNFPNSLGIRYDQVTTTQVPAYLDVTPSHHQRLGLVHGGVYCSLVETAASVGASLRAHYKGMTCVGVSNSTEFIRPHRQGRLDIDARQLATWGDYKFWDVFLTRADDGKLVAKGRVVLRNLPSEEDSPSASEATDA